MLRSVKQICSVGGASSSLAIRRHNSSSPPPPSLLPTKPGNMALFSLSTSIRHNLALESHLADLVNTSARNILLMWVSEPCVVLGRHQNPWLECDVRRAALAGVKVVRRYSGGGCVYHDAGNLNMSFITARAHYDRQVNLELIKRSLETYTSASQQRHPSQRCSFEISPRHDIFARLDTEPDRAFKVSGSAARLAHNFAYHHCTLLFDSDMERMRLLRSNLGERIVTKATPSVRSACINLRPFLADDSTTNIDLEHVARRVCEQYWRRNGHQWAIDHLFEYVDPEEASVAARLVRSVDELASWSYVFGTTPKFALKVPMADGCELSWTVVEGRISDVAVVVSGSGDGNVEEARKMLGDLLVGVRLDRESIENVFDSNGLVSRDGLGRFFASVLEFVNKNIN